MQKLFDTETPSGRQRELAEIPRRQINLGYDNIELADPNPTEKLGGWDSISDQSVGEFSNPGFSDYSGYYGVTDEEYDPFSLLTGESPLAAKRLKTQWSRVKRIGTRYQMRSGTLPELIRQAE